MSCMALGVGRKTLIVEIYTRHLVSLGYHPIAHKPEADFGVAYPDQELLNYAKVVRNSICALEIRDLKLRLEVRLPSWRPTWTSVFPP